MRRAYCCDAATEAQYRQYYRQQRGDGLPVFTGYRGQKGHGLGSLLGGLFRRAVPMLKKGLATFGKHALKTGLEIANDVVAGENVKDSAKRRVVEGIKRVVRPESFISQSGRGRKRTSTPRKISKKRKVTKRNRATQKRKKSSFDYKL